MTSQNSKFMQPKVKGIIYLGVKTDKFEELNRFYKEILELQPDHFEPGFATYLLPNGDKIEVYGSDDPHAPNHDHFTTGPVAGFEVDDVLRVRTELESKGVQFVGPIHGNKRGGSRWAHLRGPDGNVYEIKQR